MKPWPVQPEMQPVLLTPEQIILWLDGHRQFMFEVWKNNPHLREEWERLNPPQTRNLASPTLLGLPEGS